MRIGQGFDAHRFAETQGTFEVVLGGVRIPHDRYILAHSDGDVLIHALCDALLGALSMGDIGRLFPDDDPALADVDSRFLLREVMERVRQASYTMENADITVIAESPRLAAYIDSMRSALAEVLGVAVDRISIKATTTEQMGFTGRAEGIAAMAAVLLEEAD